MLQAEESLEFILDRVQELGQGAKPDQKAAYRALIHMTQRWAGPSRPTSSSTRTWPWPSAWART